MDLKSFSINLYNEMINNIPIDATIDASIDVPINTPIDAPIVTVTARITPTVTPTVTITNAITGASSLQRCHHILDSYTNDDWEQYVEFSDIYYNKIRLGEFSTDLFDIYIICWNNNQKTRIHDHPENGCLLKLLCGNLNEDIYINGDTNDGQHNEVSNNEVTYEKTNNIKVNDISYMEKSSKLHVINNTDTQSVSIHIYSPPNYKTTIYNCSST